MALKFLNENFLSNVSCYSQIHWCICEGINENVGWKIIPKKGDTNESDFLFVYPISFKHNWIEYAIFEIWILNLKIEVLIGKDKILKSNSTKH